MASLTVNLELDLVRTFRGVQVGRFDPTVALDDKRFVKHWDVDGALHVFTAERGDQLTLHFEGPSADKHRDWFAAHLPPRDGYDDWQPVDALTQRLHRALKGLRIVSVPWRFDLACGLILQQRVTYEEACREYRRIAERFGPRDGNRLAFPSVQRLAKVTTADLEALGVDPKRARAFASLVKEESFRPFLHDDDLPRLRARLMSLPGFGPWTVEFLLGFGAGDPDALPTGDLYLPHTVTWAFARERRGSDERMVQLLEPHRGQRFRVTRLLMAGRIEAPPR